MQMNQEELIQLIARIIELVKADESDKTVREPIKRPRLYCIACDTLSYQYLAFFEEEDIIRNWDAYAVIPDSLNQAEYIAKLMGTRGCKGIILHSSVSEDMEEGVTVFPVVPRELVVKTALGICDTFETRWILSCLKQNRQIVWIRGGLEKFSGQEPEHYKQKILSYYRDILQYDICIDDKVVQRKKRGEES